MIGKPLVDFHFEYHCVPNIWPRVSFQAMFDSILFPLGPMLSLIGFSWVLGSSQGFKFPQGVRGFKLIESLPHLFRLLFGSQVKKYQRFNVLNPNE